jgi:hypothetical protein
MKTLVQPIALWLVQGQQPRTFVRITDASDGSEILFAGTQALTGYEDLIEGAGRITRSIRHEGGMAEVSGASVDNLILDRRIPFCTEISLEPQADPGVRGSGRVYVSSAVYSSNPPLPLGRNALTGSLGSPAIVVGRNRTGTGPYTYTMYRGYFQCKLPPTQLLTTALTTCEDAYLELTGLGDYSTDDFTIYGLAGTWTDLAEGDPVFNSFTGWAVSGDYTVSSNWIESWTMAEYGATVRLRLNALGRAAIVTAAGTADRIFRMMLISNRDADFVNYGTGSTGAEYVQFEADTAKLVLRYNSKTLDNQPVAIYFGVDPLPTAHTLMDLVWTGINDSYEITDRTFSTAMKQNDHKKNVMIPNSVLEKDTYPYLPDENVGKIIPVLYGDFLTEKTHSGILPSFLNGTVITNRYGNGDFVKGYIYKQYPDLTSYGFYFIIANHLIKESDFYPAIWLSSKKSFAGIAGNASDILSGSDKSGEISVKTGTATDFPYNYISPGSGLTSVQPVIGEIPKLAQNYAAVNPDNAVNEDYTDWTEISVGAVGTQVEYNCPTPYDGQVYDDITLVIETYAPNGYESNKIRIACYTYEDGGDTNLHYEYLNSDGQHLHNIALEYLPSKDRQILLWIQVMGDATTKVFRFRNICIIRGLNSDIKTEVFIKAKGRYDDGSGTVTGTASALIENPSHVIESIARDEMSLTTAEIDTAAFDTAATALTGRKFAFQLLEQKPARELLNDLAFQARLKLWWDEQDRLTCKKFSATAYFPNSGTDIPGALDTYTTTGEPTGGSFTTHQIISGPKLTRMELDDVKNDFILKYKKNYATGEYSEVLRVNKDEENLDETICAALGTTGAAQTALCVTSYAAVKTVNTLTIEAWAIRDETTATALMIHLIDRLSVRRWKLEFTAGPSAVQHEEGDFINVQDDLITQQFGTATMLRKKWEIIGYDPDPITHDVVIRAIEV